MGRRTEPAVAQAELVEEPTELLVRAAAIDVAKDSGMVCTRVPHESRAGRKVQKTWTVPARYHDVIALGDHLRCQGIERVVLESTSDYWRIWFYLLEAAGLRVWLVNSRDVKNVPGRPKTDRLDAILLWSVKRLLQDLLSGWAGFSGGSESCRAHGRCSV